MEKSNAVALQGILKSVEHIDSVNSMPYAGYEAVVETERHSGITDEAIVIAPDCLLVDAIEIDKPVMVIGTVQTFKNFITGKVLVYVLAEEVKEIEGEHWEYENEVFIRGQLGRGITYRETPAGKRITDICVMVKNEIKESNCFIPCICWQSTAEMVKEWNTEQQVALKGRLQSRQYLKKLDEVTEETRTAYEVSVSVIEKE